MNVQDLPLAFKGVGFSHKPYTTTVYPEIGRHLTIADIGKVITRTFPCKCLRDGGYDFSNIYNKLSFQYPILAPNMRLISISDDGQLTIMIPIGKDLRFHMLNSKWNDGNWRTAEEMDRYIKTGQIDTLLETKPSSQTVSETDAKKEEESARPFSPWEKVDSDQGSNSWSDWDLLERGETV